MRRVRKGFVRVGSEGQGAGSARLPGSQMPVWPPDSRLAPGSSSWAHSQLQSPYSQRVAIFLLEETFSTERPSHPPGIIPGKKMADLELLQGTLDTLVLKTLSWGPRHGYAVARWIKETSDGTILVEDRALYVALHRLEERGWVESSWGLSENNRKAKYYQLTAAGRRQLQQKTSDFTAYATAMFKILEAR